MFRSKPGGGFWGISYEDEFAGIYKRWTLANDGSVSLDGEYAAPPAGWGTGGGLGGLDADGAFYAAGSFESTVFVDTIVRFSGDLTGSEVIYDEADDPICKLHGARFVTGP